MKVNSCELTEHFLCNPTTHNFGADVTIIVIEQIRKTTIAVGYKRELHRIKKAFLQKKLNTLQPTGLNKIIG